MGLFAYSRSIQILTVMTKGDAEGQSASFAYLRGIGLPSWTHPPRPSIIKLGEIPLLGLCCCADLPIDLDSLIECTKQRQGR